MAKKNFNQGLEDIFITAAAETERENIEMNRSVQNNSTEGSEAKAVSARPKKSYRKSFAVDLNNLLEDALSETKSSLENREEEDRNKRLLPKKRIKKVPLTGINALIRRTLDYDSQSDHGAEAKRVTFMCDKDKIMRLKKIAKIEKTYLKDILNELIDKYINGFEVNA